MLKAALLAAVLVLSGCTLIHIEGEGNKVSTEAHHGLEFVLPDRDRPGERGGNPPAF